MTNTNRFRTFALASVGGWCLISAIQVAARVVDGTSAQYGGPLMLLVWTVTANLAFAAYSIAQYRAFSASEVRSLGWRQVAYRLLVATPLFFVPLVVFQVAVHPIILGADPWSSLPQHVANYSFLFWSVDYVVFMGCFAAALAARVSAAHHSAEQERNRAESENLKLRLVLEQQKMRALQNQLEPHFLFNALNAISALVRGDRKRDALTAIGTLSKLLRHAVASGQLSQSTLAQECDFIRDYLALQSLRFGDRLSYTLGELSDTLASTPLPPLILQPLIENAIRHDLERHGEPSHIDITVRDEGSHVTIEVTNPLRAHDAPNQGCGIGLQNIRERLLLVYGDRANLRTLEQGSLFHAILNVPKDTDE